MHRLSSQQLDDYVKTRETYLIGLNRVYPQGCAEADALTRVLSDIRSGKHNLDQEIAAQNRFALATRRADKL